MHMRETEGYKKHLEEKRAMSVIRISQCVCCELKNCAACC